jgi:hypothetical protein
VRDTRGKSIRRPQRHKYRLIKAIVEIKKGNIKKTVAHFDVNFCEMVQIHAKITTHISSQLTIVNKMQQKEEKRGKKRRRNQTTNPRLETCLASDYCQCPNDPALSPWISALCNVRAKTARRGSHWAHVPTTPRFTATTSMTSIHKLKSLILTSNTLVLLFNRSVKRRYFFPAVSDHWIRTCERC